MINNDKRYAFTLAEVLITLGIIGIVAAMTLPTLINKINNKHLEVAFKKTYSELSQVVQKIAADNGGTLEGTLEDNSHQSVQRLLMKYMKHVKICDINPSNPHNCFAKYTYRDGTPIYSTEVWDGTMILPSGAILSINSVNSNCESRSELKYPIGCFRLRVDTNGLKRPNVLGRDVFDFYVTKDRLIPRGAPETGAYGSSSDWARAYYVLQHGID
ncbi:type II secretion system protein [bacterium]|nr:type II secretion system protein [bacterium]